MDVTRKLLERDLFALHCGIQMHEISDGYARATMELTEHHLNGVRVAQGGAIFALADTAFAAASNSHGTVAVAINVSISYVKPALKGVLFAEAREVAMSPKLSNCTVNVTDEKGELVAIFQGLAYRKKDAIEEVLSSRA